MVFDSIRIVQVIKISVPVVVENEIEMIVSR